MLVSHSIIPGRRSKAAKLIRKEIIKVRRQLALQRGGGGHATSSDPEDSSMAEAGRKGVHRIDVVVTSLIYLLSLLSLLLLLLLL